MLRSVTDTATLKQNKCDTLITAIRHRILTCKTVLLFSVVMQALANVFSLQSTWQQSCNRSSLQQAGQSVHVQEKHTAWLNKQLNIADVILTVQLNISQTHVYNLTLAKTQEQQEASVRERRLHVCLFTANESEFRICRLCQPTFEILGPRLQRDFNDLSVCYDSRATCIPRGWMGQFRSCSVEINQGAEGEGFN